MSIYKYITNWEKSLKDEFKLAHMMLHIDMEKIQLIEQELTRLDILKRDLIEIGVIDVTNNFSNGNIADFSTIHPEE